MSVLGGKHACRGAFEVRAFTSTGNRDPHARDEAVRVVAHRDERRLVFEVLDNTLRVLNLEILDVRSQRHPIGAENQVSSLERRILRRRKRIDPILDDVEQADDGAFRGDIILEAAGRVDFRRLLPRVVKGLVRKSELPPIVGTEGGPSPERLGPPLSFRL